MKKLVLMFAVVFSASLFSCGNTEATTEAEDTTAVAEEVVDTTAADTVAADTVVAVEEVVAE